jgi:hypothetical protein
MRHPKKVAAALAVATASLALAACGSSEENSADVVSGQLEPIAGAPAGYGSLAGEASLERTDEGTVTTLRATGLTPTTAYVAHLHTAGCSGSDPGGPHFKFDPTAGDEPPNEIHLEFSSDASGSGKAEASSDREVPAGKAGSLVLHEAEEGQMTAAVGDGGEAEAVFVHEGHDHGDEAGAGAGAGGHDDGPAAIACAELEGGAVTATGPTVVVRNGEPVGGVQELEFDSGDEVAFTVESDVADEVHVHGYDLMEDVSAGGEVSFDFPAEIEGIFEVELEGRGEQIAELRVNP